MSGLAGGARTVRALTGIAVTAVVGSVVGAAMGAVVGAVVGVAPAAAAPARLSAHPAASVAVVPAVSPAVSSAVTRAGTDATVTLTALTPEIVTPGDAVTVRGTVTAPAGAGLTTPSVNLVLGSDPVRERRDLDAWAKGTGAANGRRAATVTLASLPPGQSATFTVTLPAGAVRSDRPFRVLPLAVEVEPEGANTPSGVARTFLAWHARKEYEKLEVATVLPVTLDPDLDLFSRDDASRELAWRSAIGPDSRVGRIIEGTRGSSVNLAVDPSVFGPYRATSAAPGTPTGTPTPGTTTPPTTPPATPPATPPGSTTTADPTASGSATPTSPATPTSTPSATATRGARESPAITALSQGLASALRDRRLWALPYADADVAVAADTDPGNPLVRDLVNRASLVAAAVGHPVRSDVAWPVDALLPAGRERGLTTLFAGTGAKLAGIVVKAPAITAASTVTPTARRVAAGGARLLAYDTTLSGLLPQRTDPGPVLGLQRYLAETLVVLGERSGTPRSLLVVAPRTYDPAPQALATFVAVTGAAPWITPVDAADLLTDAGSDRAAAQQNPPSAVPSAAPRPTLTPARLAQFKAQADTIRAVASVLRDGDAFEQTYRELLDELTSVRWRYQPKSWVALNNLVVADTKQATSAIKVVAQSVNFLAENGTLQITVDNGLDFEVEDIRLVLSPTNPRMQVVSQPGPITIAPGSKRVVRVPVTAVAAGQADIRAYLTTADGTPIGSPAIIPVSANPLDSTIYWVGGILVGLVLLMGVVRAVVKGTSRIDEIGDAHALTARRGANVGEEGPDAP